MSMTHDQATTALARHSVPWAIFLVAASAIGSLVFACATPFSALAAVAAMTLPLRLAIVTSAGVWAVNQAVGYGLLSYPVDANSLSWGFALGVAAVAAAVAAWSAARRLDDHAEPVRWVGGFAAALGAHQILLFATSFVLGGGEGFTMAVITAIAALNAIWALGLALVHRVLVLALGRGVALTARRA